MAEYMFDLNEFRGDFMDRYGYRPAIFSAPGRVNLIGEHTDYNDGFVLPFAIDKRTYVGYSARGDGVINVHSRTVGKSESFAPGDSKVRKGWGRYIRGMAEILQRRGHRINGADLLIDSEIPLGAGLSSSAALEISVGLAFTSTGGKTLDLVDLAFVGQEVEHNYLGVRSGIMDQFTSALGKAGSALLIDCRTSSFEPVPLDLGELALVVCDSNVEHELAGSEYNLRREQCEKGVEIFRTKKPVVKALRDVSELDLEAAEEILPEVIYRRCRHVITENARTLESVSALKKGDLDRLGDLMYRSHESLKDDYEVSCDELDVLVAAASEFDGVLGARMTGGGFGGCTINLVKKDRIDDFIPYMKSRFQKAFGRDTNIFRVIPSDGAQTIDQGR